MATTNHTYLDPSLLDMRVLLFKFIRQPEMDLAFWKVMHRTSLPERYHR